MKKSDGQMARRAAFQKVGAHLVQCKKRATDGTTGKPSPKIQNRSIGELATPANRNAGKLAPPFVCAVVR